MEHFTKGHDIKKQPGVDDDRRGEEKRNSAAKSIPLQAL